jgi:hypothetical protein
MSGSTNTLLTVDMITKEATRIFENSCFFLDNIGRYYDPEFKTSGAKIGQTLRLRQPSDFTVTDGPALNVQGVNQVSTPLTVATQKHVDIAFTGAEMVQSLTEYSENVLKPAIVNLVGAITADIMSMSLGFQNVVTSNIGGGTITSPGSLEFMKAGAALKQRSAPMTGYMAVLHPETEVKLVQSLQGLFNPTGRISKQYDDAVMYGPALNIAKWGGDQTVPDVIAGGLDASGTAGAMPTVNGANQSGNVLLVTPNATNPASLNVGDRFTIAGVYGVNRVTKAVQGQLRQFVVTAPYAAGGTSISISPSITPPVGGAPVQYQTVAQSPASGAALSFIGVPGLQFRNNFVLHPESITMAMVDLPVFTNGVIACSRANYKRTSLRILQSYLPNSDQAVTRIDVLYGYAIVKPEWGTVVMDASTN